MNLKSMRKPIIKLTKKELYNLDKLSLDDIQK